MTEPAAVDVLPNNLNNTHITVADVVFADELPNAPEHYVNLNLTVAHRAPNTFFSTTNKSILNWHFFAVIVTLIILPGLMWFSLHIYTTFYNQ